MQMPVLIEPVEGGRFRARSGEPFAATVLAESAEEARLQLENLVRERLKSGSQLATINVGNVSPPFHLEALPEDDWFFQTLREAIAENRRREDEAAP